MIILSVLTIPLLVMLLLVVFIVGASVGTTQVTYIGNDSATPTEDTTDSQPTHVPLPVESWQADFSSLDTPAGE